MSGWLVADVAAGIAAFVAVLLLCAWAYVRVSAGILRTHRMLAGLAAAVGHVSDGIVLLGSDGRIRYANPQFERRSGLVACDLVGHAASEAIGIPAEVVRAIADCAISGSRWTGRAMLRDTAGKVSEEEVFVAPAGELDMGQSALVAVFRDVTGRASNALENERLAAAVRYAADSIEILDAEGRIQYVNPAYERNQNVTLANVRGHRPEEVEKVVVQDGAYNEMLQAALYDGRTWSGLLKSHIAGGRMLEEQVTVSPIRDDAGQVTSFVIVKRDVTETRLLEMQLARAHKLEAIGQLAAGIAHEINTPMQFVGDNLRFLDRSFRSVLPILTRLVNPAESTREPNEEEFLALIRDADLDFLVAEVPLAIEQSLDGCQRIAHIVKAMKDFSHPGADMTAVDLNRAIASTITVATNEWKYVAEIHLDLDPDLPQVVCHVGEVNQVVLNMLVNAAHAIGDIVGDGAGGKGAITISTRRSEEGIRIAIADTGTGIPPEIRGRLFDPFFTTKEVGRGTGQGLAIAYDVIVRKHQGWIDVESEVGRGTTFTLHLPDRPAKVTPLAA
ncbi:MAG: ATP-binding protein [Gammaproteobacteria bacterium]